MDTFYARSYQQYNFETFLDCCWCIVLCNKSSDLKKLMHTFLLAGKNLMKCWIGIEEATKCQLMKLFPPPSSTLTTTNAAIQYSLEWTMNPYRIINTRKYGGYHKRTLCRQQHGRTEIITTIVYDICLLYFTTCAI